MTFDESLKSRVDPSILTLEEQREKSRMDNIARLQYAKDETQFENFKNFYELNVDKDIILKGLNIDEKTYNEYLNKLKK